MYKSLSPIVQGKVLYTQAKTVVNRIADIGYELFTEQNVAADDERFEWYFKAVHRNELFKYLFPLLDWISLDIERCILLETSILRCYGTTFHQVF